MGIVEDLNSIMKARYGKDVRQAIHDSISEINDVANDSKNAAITAQNSASASAASANTSASNAKYSEDKAKDYMEKAFAAIPEGYEEFVDDVIELKSDISFKDHDTATSGTSFTDAEDGNMLVTDWTKNLLNPTLETCEINGVTCTNNGDGTYTLNGTATSSNAGFNLIGNEGGNSVWLTMPADGKFIFAKGDVTSKIEGAAFKSEDGATMWAGGIIPEGTNIRNIYIAVWENQTLNNVVIKPMITTDLSATYDDFVPYGGYEIHSCGKNLIPYPYYNGSDTRSGITATVNNDDGSITLKGTATSNYFFVILHRDANGNGFAKKLRGKTVTISGGTSRPVLSFAVYDEDGNNVTPPNNEIVYDYGSGVTITIPDNACDMYSYYYFPSKNTVDVTLRPQLEVSDVITVYEPYTGETITVTNDTESPAFGLKSHKGITNIISPGNVKCVYPTNESGKGVLDSLYNKDKVLTEQNKSLEVLGKCKNLLKPTLETCEKNGITCTNNGDGTYTLNGTANAVAPLSA